MRRTGFSVALLVSFAVFGSPSASATWPPALIYDSSVNAGYAMAIDGEGALLAVAPGDLGKGFLIKKFTATGTLVRSALTGGAGVLRAPESVAVDAPGNVYVADTYASRIQIFDKDLLPLTTWERSGWIEYPRDIEIGADDRVYVKTLTEVQIFDTAGEPIARWPAPGGIFTVEHSGNILIVEPGVFHRYDSNGTLLADIPEPMITSNPTSLLAYEHTLLVGTAASSPVLAFDENGVYRDAWKVGGRLLAKGPQGEIYVGGLTHYTAPGDALPPPPPPPPPPPAPGTSAVMLHVGPAVSSDNVCTTGPHSADEIVTEAIAKSDGSAQYSVYVLASPRVVANGLDGLKGVQIGIDHSGSTTPPTDLRIWDWHTCSDAEWPTDTWPNSGAGNTITWVSCNFAPLLTVGAFTVTAYAPASMAIAGYPATGLVKTANCNAAEEVANDTVGLDRVGWISMGGAARGLDRNGCNPAIESCVAQPVVPARPTTWGKVKSLYGNH